MYYLYVHCRWRSWWFLCVACTCRIGWYRKKRIISERTLTLGCEGSGRIADRCTCARRDRSHNNVRVGRTDWMDGLCGPLSGLVVYARSDAAAADDDDAYRIGRINVRRRHYCVHRFIWVLCWTINGRWIKGTDACCGFYWTGSYS